jgi:hypothetical protein
MARKKPEGIEVLAAVAPEPVSIQDITMLDWYAAFALMGIGSEASNTTAVSMAFDRAEMMMAERERRNA